jgi:hypothetical protein
MLKIAPQTVTALSKIRIQSKWIRIRTESNPDPQHWFELLTAIYQHKNQLLLVTAATQTNFYCEKPKRGLLCTANCLFHPTVLSEKCDSVDMWQFSVKTRPRTLAAQRLVIQASCSQTSYRNLPCWKSKLGSELWQNRPDLRTWFYIFGCPTLKAVA